MLGKAVDDVIAVNIQLWHNEIIARRPSSDDGTVARAKRIINQLGVHRAETVEALDDIFKKIFDRRG